jgi:hypothetical protein
MIQVKVVLVTGSRDWPDSDKVWSALQEHLGGEFIAILRHGACPTGADAMADAWGDTQPGIAIDRMPANWGLLGKKAGPDRNSRMVRLGADVCLAFPLLGSRGTIDTMRKAAEAGIRVVNYGEKVHWL